MLTGDVEKATGPVLNSTEKSKVFVFYADHGAPGFVCMPSGKNLYADQLQEAIDTMKEKKMYDEMVFYVEACESGSMFPKLKADDKVYAMTASNAKVSSWATYCSPQDKVDGVKIGSCLGDLFSVNWMEDTEANNPKRETIIEQYENVLKLTTKSPVCEFGDKVLKQEHVGAFEGVVKQRDANAEQNLFDGFYSKADKAYSQLQAQTKKWLADPLMSPNLFTVDSRDAKLHYLEQ